MGPAAGAASVRQAWDAISAGRTLEEQALGCPELKAAMDSFGGA
jgi:ribulose-bisphosphate carboxylase large chain